MRVSGTCTPRAVALPQDDTEALKWYPAVQGNADAQSAYENMKKRTAGGNQGSHTKGRRNYGDNS